MEFKASVAPLQSSTSEVPAAVFLTHCGVDVQKKSFLDHLLASLESAGVHSFNVDDCQDLHGGEDSWDAAVISSAIRHSKVHIAIISPGYANSPRCLTALHEIHQCRTHGLGRLFVPIFFNLAPSDLRHDSSSPEGSCYVSASAELLEQNDVEVVNKWRNALYQASMVNGWTLMNDATERSEARLVKLIVSEVLDALNGTYLGLDTVKHPVGLNESLQEALDLMHIHKKARKGVNVLGIYGTDGVGKTTLVESIYSKIHREFDRAYFMKSVRSDEAKSSSGRLRGLQERMARVLLKNESICVTSTSHATLLLRTRLPGLKVLLVLDDVDDREHVEALISPFESCPLQDGSQIVITTRDEQILTWAKAHHQRLFMEGLREIDAHKLFNWHAFLRREEPSEGFKELAKKLVDACQCLPLALETLGAHLYCKDMAHWVAVAKALEEGDGDSPLALAPAERDVTSILRISYDGLESEERLMFLDIACFMLGESEARAKRVWSRTDAAEFCLETLRLKSLVKLDGNGRLTMHDLLRDMGRGIVEAVSPQQGPGQCSHLWNEADVRRVLQLRKGSSEVRGVRLDLEDDHQEEDWHTQSFTGMDSLQFLVLRKANITGDFSLLPTKELRWFQWRCCPLESLPRELALANVVVLDLQDSALASLSNGHTFENLRELNLSGCKSLNQLPDFGRAGCCSRLEVLDLSGCVSLESVPESIGCLSSSLTYLDLRECELLSTLPDGLTRLSSLRSLRLDRCFCITSLPDGIGELRALEEVCLVGLESLELLPESFGDLTNLTALDLEGFRSLRELPSTLCKLQKLTSFSISHSPEIEEIPRVETLTNLVRLEVTYCTSMSRLPDSIGNLRQLVTLNLRASTGLSCLPSSIGKLGELESLNLSWCNISDAGLPAEICNLSSLRELLLEANPLSRLPEHLHLLSRLQTLGLQQTDLGEISGLLPPSLEDLDMWGCCELARLPSLTCVGKTLRRLVLVHCSGLRELMGLDSLADLEELDMRGCEGLVMSTLDEHLQLPYQVASLGSVRRLDTYGTGLSLGPWIKKLGALECLTLAGSGLPTCFSRYESQIHVQSEPDERACWIMEARVPTPIVGGAEMEGCIKAIVFCIAGWHSFEDMHVEVKYIVAGDGLCGFNSRRFKFRGLIVRDTTVYAVAQVHIAICRAVTDPLLATLKGGDTVRAEIWGGAGNRITNLQMQGAVRFLNDEDEIVADMG